MLRADFDLVFSPLLCRSAEIATTLEVTTTGYRRRVRDVRASIRAALSASTNINKVESAGSADIPDARVESTCR